MTRILHRLAGLVIWVLITVMGGAFVYANGLNVEEGVFGAFYVSENRMNGSMFGGILLLFALLYLVTLTSRRPKFRTISFNFEGGTVSISVNAVSDFIRKLGDEFGAVISLEPRIRSEKDLISIDLDVKIQTGTRIPELSQLLQDRVRESIRDGLGIVEVREIKVHIREIVGAPPPSHSV